MWNRNHTVDDSSGRGQPSYGAQPIFMGVANDGSTFGQVIFTFTVRLVQVSSCKSWKHTVSMTCNQRSGRFAGNFATGKWPTYYVTQAVFQLS